MKKFKKIICSVISICACAVVAFAGGCSTRLTGNLFDKKVLEKAKIPFLTKPENPIDESYTLYDYSYSYTCYSDDCDYLFSYAEEQFNKLVSAEYTTAYLIKLYTTSDMIYKGESYYILKSSSALSDFKKDFTESFSYEIFYSDSKLSDLEEVENHGLLVKAYTLCFSFSNEKDERGLYKLAIGLGGNALTNRKDYIECYITTDN